MLYTLSLSSYFYFMHDLLVLMMNVWNRLLFQDLLLSHSYQERVVLASKYINQEDKIEVQETDPHLFGEQVFNRSGKTGSKG